jgi:hypothetical protein
MGRVGAKSDHLYVAIPGDVIVARTCCEDRRNEKSFERIFLASGVTAGATASRKDSQKRVRGR